MTVCEGQPAEARSPVCVQTVTLAMSALLTSKSLFGRPAWTLLINVFHSVAAGLPLATMRVGVS